MQLLEECGDWFFSRRLLQTPALRDVWLAAWRGDAQSQYRIAHESITGGPKRGWGDIQHSSWLHMAARGGVAEAQYEIAKGFESRGDRDSASYWKWQAAMQKHEGALQELRDAGDGIFGAFARE